MLKKLIKQLARRILSNDLDEMLCQIAYAYGQGVRYGWEMGKIYGRSEVTGNGIILGRSRLYEQVNDIVEEKEF